MLPLRNIIVHSSMIKIINLLVEENIKSMPTIKYKIIIGTLAENGEASHVQ